MPDYSAIVAKFAATGSELIRTDCNVRYARYGIHPKRPLEPGFIPIDAPPRVTIVSYYPNASDIKGVDYQALRERFDTWGRAGTVEAYTAAYRDWLDSLTAIPFYRQRTLPILEGIGLTPEQIAWLPLIKVPLPSESPEAVALVDEDIELLWPQLQLLAPRVILVQGLSILDRVRALAEGRPTERHRIVGQSLAGHMSVAKAKTEIDKVVKQLRRALAD